MEWQADYRGLLALLRSRGPGMAPAPSGKKPSFLLDFEYKKDVNLGLVVKQVRPIPLPAAGTPVTAFLFDDPVDWVVAQKEAADVFANHRLKSLWRLHARTMRLTRKTWPGGRLRPKDAWKWRTDC
jgi:hypothetical protein